MYCPGSFQVLSWQFAPRVSSIPLSWSYSAAFTGRKAAGKGQGSLLARILSAAAARSAIASLFSSLAASMLPRRTENRSAPRRADLGRTRSDDSDRKMPLGTSKGSGPSLTTTTGISESG